MQVFLESVIARKSVDTTSESIRAIHSQDTFDRQAIMRKPEVMIEKMRETIGILLKDPTVSEKMKTDLRRVASDDTGDDTFVVRKRIFDLWRICGIVLNNLDSLNETIIAEVKFNYDFYYA